MLSAYSYFTPLTGVTGTPGALLVIGSSLALVIDGLILWLARGGSLFFVFWALGLLGAIGTLSAAFFLHSWWLMGTMLIVLAGLVVTLVPRLQTNEAA